MKYTPFWQGNNFSDEKKVPTYYGTWKFITMFKQPATCPHPSQISPCPLILLHKIPLILSSTLCLGLQTTLLPQISHPKTCMDFSAPTHLPHASPTLSTLTWSPVITFGQENKSWSPILLGSFLHSPVNYTGQNYDFYDGKLLTPCPNPRLFMRVNTK